MANSDDALPFGVYETAVTKRVSERISATKGSNAFAESFVEPVDDQLLERYTEAITRTISEHLTAKLLSTKDPLTRLQLLNKLADLIDPDDRVESEQLLHAVYESGLGEAPTLQPTALTGASLLTNASSDLSMAAEIKREIRTADRVDLLCAFIKNSGIAVIRDQLEYLRDNGIPLRVITSTYCGASDLKAVNRLVEEFGAEVKVGYESQDTRLHAKAWLFRRNSGFDTAYIGSSNLSNSALIDGVEWNVRASRTTTPAIVDKFEAVFETYWNDKHYSTYTPSEDAERLASALSKAKKGAGESSYTLSGLRIEPLSYQEPMLEALDAERKLHDRHKNLIVAATGTGKTIVAALDYRRMVEEQKRKPPLLFVAHRIELLEQAMRVYREVLQDPNFGELLSGLHVPARGTHVFATIQTLNNNLEQFSPEQYIVVVIDEFHHAQASTYQKLLSYIQPKELLGLTATPERGDGVNVAKFFDYRIAYELRVWDALQNGLLAPMSYFGINDGTDLRDVKWSRTSKAYDTSELSDFYIRQGDSRVRLILSELEKHVFDFSELVGLGFCVSIKHAEFMAERFSKFGLPAQAVTSATPESERRTAIERLRNGELKVLFTVDLFNEGVDIPDVNTLLLLRPTESPIVFLQQLGRGLRRQPGKVCTVLDFLGMQNENFNFEARYSALTGKRGRRLQREIEEEFPSLPGGTNIQLDAVTSDRALRSVRRFSRNNIIRLRALVQQEGTTDLSEFLANTYLQIEDLYRSKDGGWTRLLRSQGLYPQPADFNNLEEHLLSRVAYLLHVNDPERARVYVHLSTSNFGYESLSETEKIYARMLISQVWSSSKGETTPKSWAEALALIQSVPSFGNELQQVFDYTVENARIVPQPIDGPGAGVLFTHADYSRAELTAAMRDADGGFLASLPQGGVYYARESRVDLFLVTLVKDEKRFSERTNYKDFPITRDLFQWESQSTTALNSETGQRYIHHQQLGSRIYLCVRNSTHNSLDNAGAYTLLGDVSYVKHQGEKPIRFEWKLHRPMPAKLYEQGRAVV